jgi:arginase
LGIRNKNIVIIEAESELGAGTRGASLGPKALRICDRNQSNLLSSLKTISISSYDVLLNSNPNTTEWAKNIGHIYDFNRVLSATVEKELEKGSFVIILSGDHSNAIGGVSGFRNFLKNKECRLTWIDAHGDLHSPYTSPSGNMHGMPLAALLGHDNMEDALRDIDHETHQQWEDIKNLCRNERGSLQPQEILLAGIRDLEEEEWDMVNELGIRHLSHEVFKNENITHICTSATAEINSFPLYISFDVDVLDPTISDGTGTPVKDGITATQSIALLQCLVNREEAMVLEITEMNPLLDSRGNTLKVVLDILSKILPSPR